MLGANPYPNDNHFRRRKMLEQYRKSLSGVKEKPKIAFSVSQSEIDRLNYYVGRKLIQNQYERNVSMIDAKKCIIM